jgi:succinate dehydrogenase/fumarate reductase cytochrome b subunit
MGSEISAFVVEPIMGISILVLAIFAIIRQNQNEKTSAKWFAIGAVALTVLLVIINIILAFFV